MVTGTPAGLWVPRTAAPLNAEEEGGKVKRSHINRLIDETKELLHSHNIKLPPFGYWTPEDWKGKGPECDEIRDCMLGWDVTDFGKSNFDELGLVIFTVRNGHPTLEKYKDKTYCEKLLIMKKGQICPMHYHFLKSEDIINRAAGDVVIHLYNKTEDDKLDTKRKIEVSLDGVRKTLPAGAKVTLTPGESITLVSCVYHKFEVAEGSDQVILGEVSKVNDDNTDNAFLDPLGRFPKVEEDVPPNHYLCNEYPS